MFGRKKYTALWVNPKGPNILTAKTECLVDITFAFRTEGDTLSEAVRKGRPYGLELAFAAAKDNIRFGKTPKLPTMQIYRAIPKLRQNAHAR